MPNETHELLPEIDFAVVTSPRAVISDLATLARDLGTFEIEKHFDVLGEGGFDVVNFKSNLPSCHEGFGGQLIARKDRPNRVLVEMRSIRWSPDPPTRELYCQEARQMFAPLLAAYNHANSTRFRLRIERPRNLRSATTPSSKKLFDRFTMLANTRSLHPRDWDRFYDFVAGTRKPLGEAEIRVLLLESGFSPQSAYRLADIYVHLDEFKRR